MRHILFGALGLALGVLVAPVAAQDSRTAPPAQRAAKLGRPTAITDSPATDSTITPVVGLMPQGTAGTIPIPSPMPPPPGAPMGGMPMTGSALPPPRSNPNITEDRGTGGAAGVPGYPPGTVFQGLAPSVGPEGYVPQPGMEVPFAGDCPMGNCPLGGCPAINRVAGCGRWWSSGEYLMWWNKTSDIPPLVTTSSPQFNGHLGVGNTQTLLGGQFGETFHSGGRFTIGRWFGDDEIRGVELRMFFIGQAGSTFTATTGEFPLLARPFNNVNPNTPFFGSDSQVVADSTRANGGVTVHTENSMWGGEANYRRFLFGDCCARVDAIVGYRYLNMSEQLSVTESFIRVPGPVGTGFPATSGTVMDQFRTENIFNGGQIGLAGEIHRGKWSLDGRATVAFGNMTRNAEISGAQSLVLANGMNVSTPGGLLTVPGSNIGKFSDNVFAVIPEVGLNVGYQLTQRLRLFVGYNFLYMGNALRPGQVIDPNIDAARIPNFLFPNNVAPIAGLAHPTPQMHSSGFFVQGVSFGLQFNW